MFKQGTPSLLRFFQSDKPVESSSSGSKSNSELIEEELPLERLLKKDGNDMGTSDSGRDEPTGAWGYNIDEIDPTVVNELPPEIQEEVRTWLRPHKRADLVKRGSNITHYFYPQRIHKENPNS
ncbi:unnamed protein product [Ilex paraguariensis]|uniref:Uncharacterized protein n=1 Tax=Ilex paraguariensis TaxID=185542 RepID=A0ABC8RJM3_9AQUA